MNATEKQSSIESQAIYAAFIGGGIGFVVSVLLFWGGDISLFSRGVSLGFVGSILGGIIALVTYLIASSRGVKKSPDVSWWKYIDENLTPWSLAVVHGLLIFLSYALMFYIVSQSFKDAEIDIWSASTLVALTSGFAAYIVYLSATSMTAVRVSMLLAMFLISGTFISMLTSSDPHWWYKHFSSLGAGGGVSGYAFNATLIVAGLVIIALTRYITDDFNKLKHSGAISQKSKINILQILLTGIGIMLAFVGLFVYDQFPLLHNTSAGGMAIMFLAIVLLLPVLTPGFANAFFIASYSLLAVLLVCFWLGSSVHYLNLTMFELLAAAIIFTWLVIFVRYVAAMLNDQQVTSVTLSKGEKK
jgi:hypothetical protein